MTIYIPPINNNNNRIEWNGIINSKPQPIMTILTGFYLSISRKGWWIIWIWIWILIPLKTQSIFNVPVYRQLPLLTTWSLSTEHPHSLIHSLIYSFILIPINFNLIIPTNLINTIMSQHQHNIYIIPGLVVISTIAKRLTWWKTSDRSQNSENEWIINQ
jgi:hypothetical protein